MLDKPINLHQKFTKNSYYFVLWIILALSLLMTYNRKYTTKEEMKK